MVCAILLCSQGFQMMKINVLPLQIFIGIILDRPSQVINVMDYNKAELCCLNLKVLRCNFAVRSTKSNVEVWWYFMVVVRCKKHVKKEANMVL